MDFEIFEWACTRGNNPPLRPAIVSISSDQTHVAMLILTGHNMQLGLGLFALDCFPDKLSARLVSHFTRKVRGSTCRYIRPA